MRSTPRSMSYRLSDEIKDRKSQAYSLMHDEIKEL